MVEHLGYIQSVGGSIPSTPTKKKRTRKKKPPVLSEEEIQESIDFICKLFFVHPSYILDIKNRKYYNAHTALIKELYRKGLSYIYIAKLFKCDKSTVYNRLNL